MLTALVGAHEGRDVAVTDAPGARLNATIDEFTLLKIVDEQVDATCRMNEKCAKCVSKEKEKKALHVILNKALCGCVQSALLWHEFFSSTLVSMGFKLNPHDLCVAN